MTAHHHLISSAQLMPQPLFKTPKHMEPCRHLHTAMHRVMDKPLPPAEAMEAAEELNKKIKKRNLRNLNTSHSFSASLPDDVRGVFADSICAVKYSKDPFSDLRESIIEMINDVGVRDWDEMEELVYCFVVLNSSEIHGFIGDAFLSLCCSIKHLI